MGEIVKGCKPKKTDDLEPQEKEWIACCFCPYEEDKKGCIGFRNEYNAEIINDDIDKSEICC